MRVNMFLLITIIVVLVIIAICIVLKCISNKNKLDKLDELYYKIPDGSFKTVQIDNGKIPYILHKTGPHAKDSIPEVIKKAMDRSAKHLGCEIKYYDDDDCIRLISQNFDPGVLKAYNMLKPTAYKADLFRYCCLYLYGGVYSDIGHIILHDYQINQDNFDMILVKDRLGGANGSTKCRTQISFMATIPLNNFYKYLIDNISKDIRNKKYGTGPLDITGPDAFGRYFEKYFKIKKIGKNFINPQNLKGLDGKKYKIVIPFEQEGETSLVYRNNNLNIFIRTKIPNYNKVVYTDIKKRPRYHVQWHDRQVYID